MAAVALMAGPAVAGNLPYNPPEASSPLYAPTALHAADIDFGAAYASGSGIHVTQLDATGRLAGPLAGWMKGEVELRGSAYFTGGNSIVGIGTVGHLYKEGANHAVGAFAGATHMDDVTLYIVGGEAKAYLGPNALTGQAGYLTASTGGHAYMFDGQLDHYFTPDHKGSVLVSYYTSQGTSLWLAGLGLEKRLTGTNWSLTASGSYLHANGSGAIWSARVGARLFFDEPGMTLQQHDRVVPFSAAALATLAR